MNKVTQTSISAMGNRSRYKRLLQEASVGLARKEFEPLRSWPAIPHPEQGRINEFLSIPSRYKD